VKTSCLAASISLLLTAGGLPATELYNLDFTPPEVGQYQVVFGTPSVQPMVGPFTDALVFDAVKSYEQIRLPISVAGSRYEFECDLLVHNLRNSDYVFAVLMDTPNVRTVSFDGRLNRIEAFPSFTNLGSFSNDQVYHLTMILDLGANFWSIALDGIERYRSQADASGLQAIRINMGAPGQTPPDAPGVYAAIDNVRVSVVPEPQSLSLLGFGLFICGAFCGRKRVRRLKAAASA
jgi:hypothetical protein